MRAHGHTIRKDRKKPRALRRRLLGAAGRAGAGHQGQPRLSDRRLGLHLPRLPRAAAADAAVGRPARGRGARLLRHAVEAAAGARKRSSGPTHLAVIFDASEKTFRNEIYKDYKAHRPPAPEELVPQFPLIRDAVKAFNIACIEQNGYEADDLIATYAKASAGRRRRRDRSSPPTRTSCSWCSPASSCSTP